MKKTVCCLLSLVMAVSIISGCSRAGSGAKVTGSADALSDSSFSTALKQKEGYTKVAANERLELYVNGKTAEFCVKDIQSGKEWRSAAGSGESNGSLRSQIQLTYANDSSQISTMNSFTDGVELEQYTWESYDDGIKVIYDIGKRKKTYLFPKVITKSRMEEKILSKLDDIGRNFVEGLYTLNSLKEASSEVVKSELIKKYPKIKEEDVYVVYDGLADFVSQKLESQIISAGYTKEDLEKDQEENGVEAEDESISFRIPIEYRLEKDSLTAKVVAEEIVTPSNAHLLTLDLLPYFGAADEKQEGYMLVPDGCGAIIRLNNGKASQGTYQMPLYGTDLSTEQTDNLTQKQILSLPVYGMKQGDSSFLAVIESGAAIANIRAAVGGTTNSYNNIYPSFTLNNTQKADVPYSQATSMYFYQKEMASCDLQVRFCFLNKDDADYSGMARRYQQYLIENGVFTQTSQYEPALYLNLLGAINQEDNVFGIPVQKTVALTSFSEAETIVKTLKDKGVGSVVVRYEGWCNGGLLHSALTDIKVQKQLGGLKAQKKFQSFMEESGNRVYWDMDLQYIPKNTLLDGYSSIFDSPRTIIGETAFSQQYNLVSGKSILQTALLSPGKYSDFAKQAINSLAGCAGQDVSIGSMSNMLYSDFNSGKQFDRQQAAEAAAQTAALFRNSGKVLGSQPSDYVFESLSEVMNAPGSSNGYSLFDEEVPFYQMVIHGYLSYAGEPLNYANSIEDEILRMIETGTMPGFEWMYQSNSVLKKIDADYFAVSYREWLDDAIETYTKVSGALNGLQGRRIVAHSKTAGVSCTEYDDGTKVYVNYNETDAAVDGHTVKARDYFVIKGGRG
ncbi:MAG: hypothetical protein KHW79_09430 [Clostridiales bacterium]|nr:hypothetical protein [Clostridiales bacterium]